MIITPQTFFAVCTEGRLSAFDSRESSKVICLWLKNSTQDTFQFLARNVIIMTILICHHFFFFTVKNTAK